jgi:hypothetical protein
MHFSSWKKFGWYLSLQCELQVGKLVFPRFVMHFFLDSSLLTTTLVSTFNSGLVILLCFNHQDGNAYLHWSHYGETMSLPCARGTWQRLKSSRQKSADKYPLCRESFVKLTADHCRMLGTRDSPSRICPHVPRHHTLTCHASILRFDALHIILHEV